MASDVEDDEGIRVGMASWRQLCDATLDWNMKRGGKHGDGTRRVKKSM